MDKDPSQSRFHPKAFEPSFRLPHPVDGPVNVFGHRFDGSVGSLAVLRNPQEYRRGCDRVGVSLPPPLPGSPGIEAA